MSIEILSSLVLSSAMSGFVVDKVPSMVLVQDGIPKIVYSDLQNPSSQENLSAVLPDKIPVYEVLEDGSRNLGLTFRNNKKRFGFVSRCEYPAFIVLDQAGSWAIDTMRWSLMDRVLGPGEELYIHGSEDARLVYEQPGEPGSRRAFHPYQDRGSGSITIQYDHTDAPAYLTQSEVIGSISRVRDIIEDLFKDDSTDLVFRVEWQDVPGNTLAFAPVTEDDRRWNLLRSTLTALYSQSIDGGTDAAVYNSLPGGTNITYARPGNNNDLTDDILLSAPILKSLFGVDPGDPYVIVFDNDVGAPQWEVDAESLGLSSLNSFDFQGVLIHEMMHHLGFVSNVESLDFIFEDMISFLDLFRFNQSAGPFITGSEMIGAIRELRDDQEASSGLAISNSSFFFPMSRGTTPGGDGFQASHWKENTLTMTGDVIGIMDPLAFPGPQLNGGRWIQQSDYTALDVIGWVIDPFDVESPATEPANPDPDCKLDPACGFDPAISINLDWDDSSNVDTYSVFIYEVPDESSTGQPELVFTSSGLATRPCLTAPASGGIG